MQIERTDLPAPTFVVGAGRSGSTALFDLLTYATNAVWPTALTSGSSAFSSRMFFSLCDAPGVGSFLRRRYPPSEAYEFWNSLFPGFGTPCRDLVADDVTVRSCIRIRQAVSRMALPGRERILFKLTGWPRIGFMNAIFPSAKFVHIVRDGRAVANSLLNVKWWWGWRGPANWRWGELSDEMAELWERYDRSFVALAGIQWIILMDAMKKARASVDDERFLEIRYEDLCASPETAMQRVCEFSGLAGKEPILRATRYLRGQNDKWRKELSYRQQDILNAVLKERLMAYSYEEEAEPERLLSHAEL